MGSDDGTKSWDENIAGLENLIIKYDRIQMRALRAAGEAVAPRLVEAAPLKVSTKVGGNSLPQGALKEAVRVRVVKVKATGKPQVVIDFGKFTHIAHMVDIGHNPPNTKLAKKLGKSIAGKPTPAHPFVRSVQDSSRQIAQEAYEAAMTAGMKKALKGK